MDYSMMPPPPSTSCTSAVVPAAAGSVAADFGGANAGSHFSNDSPQPSQFSNETNQEPAQNGSQFNAGQYKMHFSGRAHVNRPPPLSLPQTGYRDNLTQSSTPHYGDHQQSPHCIPASPHHAPSPLVSHSPHIDPSPGRVLQSPHLQQNARILHRQSSAPHLVQSPHLAPSPHLSNYGGGEMSPRPTPAHLQQSLYSDRNHSPLPHTSPASRHYNESSQSPHHFNVHPSNNPVHLYNNNVPNPSPHPYAADPNPSPHHFNDPNPSPFNDQGPHRSNYVDTSQPGTPAAAGYSHPGTPAAGYVDSPHQHLSPHPTRPNYQYFFGPNQQLPVNGGAANAVEPTALDMAANSSGGGQFSQQSSTDSSQHPGGPNAMLHAGGQGDAMLSAINLNPQETEATALQDQPSGHGETAMDTDWPGTSQKMKANASHQSSFLFDSGSNPPGVDELLSQATDFIANSSTLSLSDVPKEAAKIKPRPKGRPSKNAMSPRSYGARCPVCDKLFNNSSALAKHKLTHSDERKYVCQLCSKAFKRQDHLNGHMMTHRTKKPFECSFEGCAKSYCDARSLRRHLENHHNVPTETLYDMSLPNYGLNGGNVGNMYQNFPGDPSTPSPHASPSYVNVSGQPYFRFDQSHTGSADSQQPYGFNDAPQPAECTICRKRFKNLPALNGHMRLHGGYVNAKKPDELKPNKTESNDGSSLTNKKQAPRPQQQLSGGSKTVFSTSSSTSRDSLGSVQSLMVLNNKYSMEQSVVGNTPLSMTSPSDDLVTQSNINQNNNQGNVRQGGDGRAGVAPHMVVGAGLRMNAPSSSEPSTFPANTLASQFSFSAVDQRQMFNERLQLLVAQQQQQQQLQRQLNTAASAPFPALPMMSVNVSDHLLLEMANKSRTDSFPGLLNSPSASKLSDLTQEGRVTSTPLKDKDTQSPLALPSQQQTDFLHTNPGGFPFNQLDKEDHEVSQINSGEHQTPDQANTFLADRKRHASAPDQLTNTRSWAQTQQGDQQQQLNQQYAKAQEEAQQPTSNMLHRRHRRMSADNHHYRTKDYKQSHSNVSGDLLTRSDGAVLFRSPPPGGVKKRRPRPEPLVIPPTVAAIQSRLRSPRIWEPGENQGVRHTGRTPPPYTPPPILSPMRSGTGLFRGVFWRPNQVGSTTPLSASLPATKLSHLPPEPIPEEPPQTSMAENITLEAQSSVIESVIGEEVAAEPQVPPPPETDIKPHINIGSDHQADLPALRKNPREAERDADRATLLWTPECLDHSLTVQELSAYMDFSCSAAVPGSGSNKEYALHQLYFNKGDIKRSILCLMSKKVSPSFVKFIGDYHYQDSDIWTTEEIELYTHSIMKEDKDFNQITKAFNGSKTHKQCIEFYYLWKKICREEYKRLRIIRRRRRHDELYNLRSRSGQKADDVADAVNAAVQSDDDDSVSHVSDSGEADDEDMVSDAPSSISSVPRTIPPVHYPPPPQHPTYMCEYPGCGAMFNTKTALNSHAKMHVLPRTTHTMDNVRGHSPAPKRVKTEPVAPGPGSEEFPCKLCGKVFYKVKSRSAHMKSHSVLAKKARDPALKQMASHPS